VSDKFSYDTDTADSTTATQTMSEHLRDPAGPIESFGMSVESSQIVSAELGHLELLM